MTRRPRYRYAGCHRYDSSAFNVILGQMFYYDDTGYIPPRPIFSLETVVPPVKRTRPLNAQALTKSRTRGGDAERWENMVYNDTGGKRGPILFRRRP